MSSRVFGAAALAVVLAGGADAATYQITASKFQFTPNEIEVEQGEQVVLELHSTDTDHGLEIKDMKVSVKIPKTGETVRAEFVASKPGTFLFKCTEYCGSGHSRMRGRLIVKPAAGAAQ